jgi:restriction endonuclease
LIIHTDKSGEVSKKDLNIARKASREVDDESSPINCIVSVIMLREGWDVQSVTVIVGLRPYTSKANILPEQTVGRGLRLMFRGAAGYIERVDVIGNKTFIEFVEQLEREEVQRFAKLPEQFGFTIEYTDSAGNLRYYEPDFVVLTGDGIHYIVETKGLEDTNVANKDRAAKLWSENTTQLTSKPWSYLKVLQTAYKQLQPTRFEDLFVLEPRKLL